MTSFLFLIFLASLFALTFLLFLTTGFLTLLALLTIRIALAILSLLHFLVFRMPFIHCLNLIAIAHQSGTQIEQFENDY